MTNKPMLSVERELLERIAQWGSVSWMDKNELRALLDKPVLESQYDGMTQAQAQSVSDGVDEILHGKPAAQHQGEPVYQVEYLLAGGGGWHDVTKDRYDASQNPCWRTRIVYAEQPAPVAVDLSDDAMSKVISLYASGLATRHQKEPGFALNAMRQAVKSCLTN